MRQLMAQGGNVRADERGVMRFDPDSVQVGQLLADFGWGGGRLTVRSGVMSGPAIGMTFDGFIDFPKNSLDLSGSYVPAYALNSLLSHIPVVGVLVAGGQNEGVFALNYRLTGDISAPIVTVNPLSAIAPGLMRKIMGVIDGTAHVPGMR
jgi:AsmA-like C-terminal region